MRPDGPVVVGAPQEDDDARYGRELAKSTLTSLTNAGVGLTVASLGGPLAGAAASACSAMFLKALGMRARAGLTERLQRRLGYVAVVAMDTLEAEASERPLRSDLQIGEGGRENPFAEIIESVFIRARDEAEERKTAHLGYLLAELAFRADVSWPDAHMLIRLSSDLTFRQYCLVAAFTRDAHPFRVDGNKLNRLGDRPDRTAAIDAAYLELSGLCANGVLRREDITQTYERLHPAQVQPTATAERLAELLRLHTIAEEHVQVAVDSIATRSALIGET